MTAALENGKALLTSLWDDSPAPEISMIRNRTRHRGARLAVGICAAGLLLAGLVIHIPTPALYGEGLIAGLGLAGVAVLLYVEFSRHPATIGWVTTFTLGLGICSVAVAVVQPGGTAVIGCYIAVGIAARRLPRDNALLVAFPLAALVIGAIMLGASDRLFTAAWAALGFVFTFMISRFARVGEEQQARERALLDEEKRSLAARTEAAALAERGRIAREMHDVLAHSLSALAVELEGARLLAHRHRAAPELEAAIERAHQHATTGLDEARDAIEALRGDDLPGPERLPAMARSFAGEQEVDCDLEVSGDPLPLAPDASLAIYRTAQEALTNVRKHARPERVELRLSYEVGGTRLEVADHRAGESAPDLPPGPLGEVGAGYGVSGMRERAELLGGRLEAGPTADGFRVDLWLPRATPA
jgi:signal transduction histidine kinase